MVSIIESLTITSLEGKRIGIKLIFSEETTKVLQQTVFRGKGSALAGNCCLWDGPEEMVKDPRFFEPVGGIIAASLAENRSRLQVGYDETVDVPFDSETAVGWVSALPRELVNGSRKHLAKIGEHATGMVVALHDMQHPAPLTNLLHMQLSYKPDFKCPSVIVVRVLGIGIGPDIGPLEGDLKEIKFRIEGELVPVKMVFFLPQHAGGSEIIPMDP